MYQAAPDPTELADLVSKAKLWPGWEVWLGDRVRDPASTHGGEARGLTLVITTLGYNTYHPERGQTYSVDHIFIVPAATYNRASWQRWLFERYAAVWRHEAMESFEVDGEHPYAATHAPGDNPYVVHDYATDLQRRTSFRGEVKA
jgi:hypothetical protein